METKYFELDKSNKAALAWLLKALDKDSYRPLLECVHVKGDQMTATDGFIMHALDTQPFDEPLEDGLYNIRLEGNVAVVDQSELDYNTYPDFRDVLMTDEPRTVLTINPKLLFNAISGMPNEDTSVIISLYGNDQVVTTPVVVQGLIKGGKLGYAIVMPMHNNTLDKERWMPTYDQRVKPKSIPVDATDETGDDVDEAQDGDA